LSDRLEVRVAASFFEDIDRQLSNERGPLDLDLRRDWS